MSFYLIFFIIKPIVADYKLQRTMGDLRSVSINVFNLNTV